MSATKTAERPNRLATSFAASTIRPAPPMDVPTPAAAAPPQTRAAAGGGTRIKQTLELPEDVYDAVQDFARGHRTSFQVLMRAVIDDLLAADDPDHRARVGALVATAEQLKRERRRRGNGGTTTPIA